MKIPKYIEYALEMRCKLARRLDDYCRIIDDFIDKNNIEVEFEDYHGGVELYVNPEESYDKVVKAIRNKA